VILVGVEEVFIERKSIHYYISADPGEEKTVDVFTVSPGKKFKLEKVRVGFPSGTAFELEVSIFRGLEQVKPTDGVMRGDGMVLVDAVQVWFGAGESVKLHYKNVSPTATRKAVVIIEGYEV